MGDFSICQAFVLQIEGKFSNNPRDPGGATMEGITQATYNNYRRLHGQPIQSVAKMNPGERDAIYRGQFWNAVQGDALPTAIALVVYDWGVNSGPLRAIKGLQAALGVTVDGHLGLQTLAAIRTSDEGKLVARICSRRLSFMESLRNWKYFRNGWRDRVRRCQALALQHLSA